MSVDIDQCRKELAALARSGDLCRIGWTIRFPDGHLVPGKSDSMDPEFALEVTNVLAGAAGATPAGELVSLSVFRAES